MSKQFEQPHWYQRRQMMLHDYTVADELDDSQSIVRKRQIRAERLRERSSREREEPAKLRRAG